MKKQEYNYTKKYKALKVYSRFLTTLIIVLVISLIILVGYAIYTVIDNYLVDKSAEELMSQFTENYVENREISVIIDPETTGTEEPETTTTPPNNTGSSGGTYNLGTYYKGCKVIGIISIPKLNIQYPIFDVDNSTALKYGTSAIYPANVEQALNKPGNVVIAGHNYRNSRMFSKLYTLQNGDSIFITDVSGTKLEYKVYNNYTTGAYDFDYATRDGLNTTEISLTTCTNDASTRTIVWAKAN